MLVITYITEIQVCINTIMPVDFLLEGLYRSIPLQCNVHLNRLLQ